MNEMGNARQALRLVCKFEYKSHFQGNVMPNCKPHQNENCGEKVRRPARDIYNDDLQILIVNWQDKTKNSNRDGMT